MGSVCTSYPTGCYLIWSPPTFPLSPHAPRPWAHWASFMGNFFLFRGSSKPSGLWTFVLAICSSAWNAVPKIFARLREASQLLNSHHFLSFNYFLTCYCVLIFFMYSSWAKIFCSFVVHLPPLESEFPDSAQDYMSSS